MLKKTLASVVSAAVIVAGPGNLSLSAAAHTVRAVPGSLATPAIRTGLSPISGVPSLNAPSLNPGLALAAPSVSAVPGAPTPVQSAVPAAAAPPSPAESTAAIIRSGDAGIAEKSAALDALFDSGIPREALGEYKALRDQHRAIEDNISPFLSYRPGNLDKATYGELLGRMGALNERMSGMAERHPGIEYWSESGAGRFFMRLTREAPKAAVAREVSYKEVVILNAIGIAGSIAAGFAFGAPVLGLLGTFVAAVPLIVAYVGALKLLGYNVRMPKISLAPRMGLPGRAEARPGSKIASFTPAQARIADDNSVLFTRPGYEDDAKIAASVGMPSFYSYLNLNGKLHVEVRTDSPEKAAEMAAALARNGLVDAVFVSPTVRRVIDARRTIATADKNADGGAMKALLPRFALAAAVEAGAVALVTLVMLGSGAAAFAAALSAAYLIVRGAMRLIPGFNGLVGAAAALALDLGLAVYAGLNTGPLAAVAAALAGASLIMPAMMLGGLALSGLSGLTMRTLGITPTTKRTMLAGAVGMLPGFAAGWMGAAFAFTLGLLVASPAAAAALIGTVLLAHMLRFGLGRLFKKERVDETIPQTFERGLNKIGDARLTGVNPIAAALGAGLLLSLGAAFPEAAKTAIGAALGFAAGWRLAGKTVDKEVVEDAKAAGWFGLPYFFFESSRQLVFAVVGAIIGGIGGWLL